MLQLQRPYRRIQARPEQSACISPTGLASITGCVPSFAVNIGCHACNASMGTRTMQEREPSAWLEPWGRCRHVAVEDVIETDQSFSASGTKPKNNKGGSETVRPTLVDIKISAVDFHLDKPHHSRLALELLHCRGILAAQLLDLRVVCLDAVEDGFGAHVIPA